jgi:hypothetical protein
MEEKWFSEEISELVDDDDEEYEEDEDLASFLQVMINAYLELIARLIESKTGDRKAVQIVRDSKLPVTEIHYIREED